MDGEEALDRAGHRNGADTDVELLRGGAEVRKDGIEVEVLRIAAPLRGLDEEIVKQRIAAGGLRQQKAAAAQRGQDRFGCAGRAKSGQHGIEGIAALGQHLFGRGGRRRMPAGHGAAPLRTALSAHAGRVFLARSSVAGTASWRSRSICARGWPFFCGLATS